MQLHTPYNRVLTKQNKNQKHKASGGDGIPVD